MSGPCTSSSGVYPPIELLLPQKEPMVLLDQVLRRDAHSISCSVTAGRVKVPRSSSGEIPVWVGLEYMAQSLAAFAGLCAREHGEEPRPGLVLGSRRFEASVSGFGFGRRLEVRARIIEDNGDLSVFDCGIFAAEGQSELVSTTLSVYKPKNLLEYYRHKG